MARSFLQTALWAKFKEKNGWQASQVENIWILEKKLPLGKNFLYAPEVNFGEINLENIKKNVRNSQTIFFRLEILDKFDQKIIEILKKNGFIKAFEEVQPEWRQIIDISGEETEILGQMKQKGRYNIKVAQKHGVVIEKSHNINDFYQIFCQTAKRDGFEIRPRQYFKDLLDFFEKDGIVELWVARLPTPDVVDNGGQAKYNEKVVAANITTFYEGVASYLYGASSNEDRNVMAPYLLHWEIMRQAKQKGCKFYDLLAIQPVDRPPITDHRNKLDNSEQLTVNGEHHKYAGITRFKEQFGGKKIQIVGSYDLVYKPTWYKMFEMAEKHRRK